MQSMTGQSFAGERYWVNEAVMFGLSRDVTCLSYGEVQSFEGQNGVIFKSTGLKY
jgi:hypothetical protein